jgi:hypothetical protein
MVYAQHTQTRRYPVRAEQFLTTHDHFYDSPTNVEAPCAELRHGTRHKASTFGHLYNGSLGLAQSKPASKTSAVLAQSGTLRLFPEPPSHTRLLPTTSLGRDGAFTVRHSNLFAACKLCCTPCQLATMFPALQCMSFVSGPVHELARVFSHLVYMPSHYRSSFRTPI